MDIGSGDLLTVGQLGPGDRRAVLFSPSARNEPTSFRMTVLHQRIGSAMHGRALHQCGQTRGGTLPTSELDLGAQSDKEVEQAPPRKLRSQPSNVSEPDHEKKLELRWSSRRSCLLYGGKEVATEVR